MKCQGIDIFNLNLIHIIGIDIYFFMFQQLTSQVNCCKKKLIFIRLLLLQPIQNECFKKLRFRVMEKTNPNLLTFVPLPFIFIFVFTLQLTFETKLACDFTDYIFLTIRIDLCYKNVGFDLVFLDKDIFKKCTIVLQFLGFLHF